MILDYAQRLDVDHAYTATALTQNVLDIEEVGAHQGRGLGDGEPLGVMVSIDVAPSYTTGTFTVETDGDVAIGSSTVLASFAIPTGTVAGTRYFIPIPTGVVLERYLAGRMTISGGAATVTLTSYLMRKKEFDALNISYTSGFAIL